MKENIKPLILNPLGMMFQSWNGILTPMMLINHIQILFQNWDHVLMHAPIKKLNKKEVKLRNKSIKIFSEITTLQSNR